MIRRYKLMLSLLLATLSSITGCASRGAEESLAAPPPVQHVYAAPTEGAIFRAGTEVRLFEDIKAGRVGDILTVRLVEKTNASKNANTSTSKDTQATLENPVVFGTPLTRNGIPLFEGSLNGQQTFDGKGSSSQSNSLTGDITVTVIERFPNGNLRISGEKWVTLNQGQEFIRLAGTIRPNDIEPDNSLASTRIADAKITYSSKGVMAAANRMGLISRFFLSILHPY